MVKTGVAGADKLCFALLKQLPAGSTQPGELYIAENLMHILLDNRSEEHAYEYHILPKISPLPSLTFKFLHRYVCLDYKPPSHQVDRLHILCTRASTYVRSPALQLTTSSKIALAFRKPVLKSFCCDGTSSLVKTLTSRSRCFYMYFPLKTYTHGTTSPFSPADPRVTVYLTGHLAAALLEKR